MNTVYEFMTDIVGVPVSAQAETALYIASAFVVCLILYNLCLLFSSLVKGWFF